MNAEWLGKLDEPWSAVIVAVVTALASAYLFYRNAAAQRQSQTRAVISEALAELIAWKEMPYRVARRFDDQLDTKRDLAQEFHRIQQRLHYYSSWLLVYDRDLGIEFDELLSTIRKLASPAIHSAWSDGPQGIAFIGDKYAINTAAEERKFIMNARVALSRPYPVRLLMRVVNWTRIRGG